MFCGEHGSSREDVFALWISELFKSTTPFELTSSHGRNKSGMSKFGVYSRAACQPCNNGWMSRMEAAVRPHLQPALFGTAVTWDADEQEMVAAWATKTALMLDRSSLAGQKAPLEHFQLLHELGRPPDSTQLAAGCYRPDEGEPHLGVTSGVSKGSEMHRNAYRITFSIGHIVFVLHGYSGRSNTAFHVQSFAQHTSKLVLPLWNTLPSLWPRTGVEFRWPPPEGFAFNNAMLDGLSDMPLMQPMPVWPTSAA